MKRVHNLNSACSFRDVDHEERKEKAKGGNNHSLRCFAAPFHHHPATCSSGAWLHSAAKNEQAEAEIMSRFSLHRSGKRHVRPHCNRPIPKVYFASSSIIQLPSDILSSSKTFFLMYSQGEQQAGRILSMIEPTAGILSPASLT